MTQAEWDGLHRTGVNLRNGEAIAAFLNARCPAEEHRAVEVIDDRILEFTGAQWRDIRRARAAGVALNTVDALTAFLKREPKVGVLKNDGLVTVQVDGLGVMRAALDKMPVFVRRPGPQPQRDTLQCPGCKATITLDEYDAAGGCCPHCAVIMLAPGRVLEVGA